MTRQKHTWHVQNFSGIAIIVEEKTRKNVLHTYILRIDYNSPADEVSRAKKGDGKV